jgi:hypothetical protein
LADNDERKLQRRFQVLYGNSSVAQAWFYMLYTRIAYIPTTEVHVKTSADQCKAEMLQIVDEVIQQLGVSWNNWKKLDSRYKSEFINSIASADATELANVFQQYDVLVECIKKRYTGYATDKFNLKSAQSELYAVGMKNALEDKLYAETPGSEGIKQTVSTWIEKAIKNLTKSKKVADCSNANGNVDNAQNPDQSLVPEIMLDGASSLESDKANQQPSCYKVERPSYFFFTNLLLEKAKRYQLSPLSGASLKMVGFSVRALHKYLVKTCPGFIKLNQSLAKPFDDVPDSGPERCRYFSTFWLNVENANRFLQKRIEKNHIEFDSNLKTDGKQLHVSFVDMTRLKTGKGKNSFVAYLNSNFSRYAYDVTAGSK